MKRPSFQFYPGDWLRDLNLKLCSLGAQGLWIRLMCHMHEGEPYGYLRVNGRVIPPDKVPELVGKTPTEVMPLLQELEEWGVLRKDEDGCFYSRRMVEDERKRQAAAEQGSKGGNPSLKQGKKRPKEAKGITQGLTLDLSGVDNQNPTPSSSSSASTSLIGEEGEEKKPPQELDPPPELPSEVARWRNWYQQRFAGAYPRCKWSTVLDNAAEGGMSADVIVKAIEAVIGKKNDPLSWAAREIGNMVAAGVKTLADAEEYEIRKQQAQPDKQSGGGTPPRRRTQPEEDETTRRLREMRERGA